MNTNLKKAFTIIEALVAVSILSMAFVGVIQVFPGVIKINTRNNNLTVASQLAELKAEEFIAKSYDQVVINNNPTPAKFTDSGFEKYSWQAKVTQESTDLKRIEIKVLWGISNQYDTDLITFISK